MNKVIQNCSVFPFLEKHEADMIYRIQINGCSLQCDKSVVYGKTSVIDFQSSMKTAGGLLIGFSAFSLLVYLFTIKTAVRRQLRECSCALSMTFLQLGVLFVIFSTQEWHCSNSFLCPLSTFLFTFSVLSFSGLYLFFTANIVIELKSFFGSLSLHPKEVDKIMFRWLHVIAWIAVFIISTIFTTIGLPDSVPKNGTNGTNFTSSLPIANIHPIPILKFCFFSTRWHIFALSTLHVLFILGSILAVCFGLEMVSELLPLLGFLSPNSKWSIRIYTFRLSALLFCLLFHLGTVLYAIILYLPSETFRNALQKYVDCEGYDQIVRDDCELENDVSSLTYILYSLEFCAFLQGFWPLDRSTFVFIVSLISKKEDDYFQLEQIRDVYGKRNSRKKDLNSSVILRGGSKEKSASDTSTVEQWLYSNRLVTRRPAAIPDKLIPDLKQSKEPQFRNKKALRKRNKNWSVKEGFTPHHQRAVTRWSSESSSECDDWRTRFSNYSLTNEGPLNAAIDKINQFGVSTTQSEPNSDVKSDFSIPLPSNSCLKPFSRLDQIRLSDLTSDED